MMPGFTRYHRSSSLTGGEDQIPDAPPLPVSSSTNCLQCERHSSLHNGNNGAQYGGDAHQHSHTYDEHIARCVAHTGTVVFTNGDTVNSNANDASPMHRRYSAPPPTLPKPSASKSSSNGAFQTNGNATSNGNNNKPSGPEYYMNEKVTTYQEAVQKEAGKDAHPLFLVNRDVRKPDTLREFQIVSEKGTVRGFKNRVRAGIANLLDSETTKVTRAQEKGKVVVYSTSMRIVRETYERCMRVKTILQTHMVQYEEHDVFMSRENQTELKERLDLTCIDVPQVYADGLHLGGADEMEEMNENGELRRIFKHFKKVNVMSSCEKCGGYRYLPCTACHGSRKSLHRNHFTAEFLTLRCISCDENGLIRCDICHGNELQV